MTLSHKEGDKRKEIKIMGETFPETEKIFNVGTLACPVERTQQMGEILFKYMSEKLSRSQGRPQPSTGHIIY